VVLVVVEDVVVVVAVAPVETVVCLETGSSASLNPRHLLSIH
jgi:hypothetical protein